MDRLPVLTELRNLRFLKFVGSEMTNAGLLGRDTLWKRLRTTRIRPAGSS
jgi:hypothetical protein